jgi:flagellar biosynthesis/type III secretory pathway protein FliH
MKKFTLPLVVLLALTACGGSGNQSVDFNEVTPSVVEEPALIQEVEETATSVTDGTATEIEDEISEIKESIEELKEIEEVTTEDINEELDEPTERGLKDAAIDAYHRGKDKFQEKMQDIKDSEEYQNATEKASEIKEQITDKTIEMLDNMF